MSADLITTTLDNARFGRVLSMLIASTSDEEKLAAISRANAMLATAGLGWPDVAKSIGPRRRRTDVTNFEEHFSDFWDDLVSPKSGATPSPAAPAFRKRTRSGSDIPANLAGTVRVTDGRSHRGVEMLIVEVEGILSFFGPLAISDKSSIALLRSNPDASFAGSVRQPRSDRHDPTLSGLKLDRGQRTRER